MDIECRSTMHYLWITSLRRFVTHDHVFRAHWLPLIEAQLLPMIHAYLFTHHQRRWRILANCSFVSPNFPQASVDEWRGGRQMVQFYPRSSTRHTAGSYGAHRRAKTLQGALPAIAFHCSDSSGESLSM
jgi:hypothetical protein